MPLFALICTDKADHEPLRKATRDAHLAYLNDTGCVTLAGPFLDAGTMTGSLVVIDVADKAAAEHWAAADPYALAGLFAKVRIEEWKKVIG
ncbi:YciI family protein [Pararhodobacter sp.]|uniref:YciI family protein n=1 Tax=Pararhodobacter sp. TaxID=2127056 RepID=UPI002AFDCEE7|nr:YciI family protein [Pararhodobacter sp.]